MECFATVHFLPFMFDTSCGEGGLNSNSILLFPYRDALFGESAMNVSYSSCSQPETACHPCLTLQSVLS